MTRFPFVVLIFWLLLPAFGAERVTRIVIDNQQVTGVREVRAVPNGQILIVSDRGRAVFSEDKMPESFLQSWGITRSSLKAARERPGQSDLDKAVANGLFRKVEGTVYDLRKPQPGWVSFNNVKVVQALKGKAIINITPETPGKATLIFVRNLPPLPAGVNRISLIALQTGSSKASLNRLGRTYDFGLICKRAEIPESLIKEIRPSMIVPRLGK